MTSPIGKILLAKLPKDIVQFCIEPYLMINEEEVRKNHFRVMNTFHKHDPDNYRIIVATHDPQTRLVTSVVIPHRHVAGDRLWRTKVFYKEREQQKKDLEQKKMARMEARTDIEGQVILYYLVKLRKRINGLSIYSIILNYRRDKDD